jgi:acyl-CoA thioester hydrolase
MGPEICRKINRGFAAVRHEIDYIAAAYPDDHLAIANWVTVYDGKLRAERKFQIIRLADKKTLLRAHSYYVCTNLTTGRPAKVPKEFSSAFSVLPNVANELDKI